MRGKWRVAAVLAAAILGFLPRGSFADGADGAPDGKVDLQRAAPREASGLSLAFGRAADWVGRFDLGLPNLDSWTPQLDQALTPVTQGLGKLPDAFAAHIATREEIAAWLGDLAGAPARTVDSMWIAPNGNYDQTWALGHAPASPSMAVNGAALPDLRLPGAFGGDLNTGRALSEQGLVGHNIEFALPLGSAGWTPRLSGSYFWWGAQQFMPDVHGTRVGMKLNPTPYLEFEGGRVQETDRASGAFLSARLSIPLGNF
jgi:hypothetical protein